MWAVANPAPAAPGRREQGIEVAVFLFLIMPSMALSFFAVKQGAISFWLVGTATILRDLALLSLIFFFLWRNNEPADRIGWTSRTRLPREIGLGIALFPVLSVSMFLLELALGKVGLHTPKTLMPSLVAHGGAEVLLAALLVVVVAISEESMFRGYLILRLRAASGSTAAAVVLSSIIFALGHGYEGSAGVVTVGAMGLVFALVYLWRGSLVAPITMHFLQDFVAIILLPIVGSH